MQTYIDDIGSFPLPAEIRREDYTKAYIQARDMIIKGQDPYSDPFVEKTFCVTVVDSFRKKLAAGLDVANYPQHFDGMRQVGDAIDAAMAQGSFIVDQKKRNTSRSLRTQPRSQTTQRRIRQKNPAPHLNLWPHRDVPKQNRRHRLHRRTQRLR